MSSPRSIPQAEHCAGARAGVEGIGDASLQVQFSTSTVDVGFTHNRGGRERPAISDMSWRAVPMIARALEAGGLVGRFHGADHQDAGERKRAAGAFHTTRD